MKVGRLEGWKVQEVLSYPLFPDTSTEPSVAGARRGVSNCIQRIWSFLMFIDAFRIQGIWLFLLFLDTFRIQDILSFLLFIDTFRVQGIWSFLLFIDTTFQKVSRNSKTTKSLSPVFRHFSKDFVVSPLDTFRIQRIMSFLLFLDTLEGWTVGRLEGRKVRRLECSRGLIISPVSRHFHRAERRRREARRV